MDERKIRDAHERHARLLADGVPKGAAERVACEAELHALLGTTPVAALTDEQRAVAKAAVDELLGD